MDGVAEEVHLDVELLEVLEDVEGPLHVARADKLDGVCAEHGLGDEGDVLFLECYHAFAHGAADLVVGGQLEVVDGALDAAVEAVLEGVVDVEHCLGVAVVHGGVEHHGEGVAVHAEALAAGDVEQLDGLGVVDAVLQGLDFVVDEGAEDGPRGLAVGNGLGFHVVGSQLCHGGAGLYPHSLAGVG